MKEKIDCKNFLGQYVKISLFRRFRYRAYSGMLTDIAGDYVQIRNATGRYKWIRKPRLVKDKIEIEVE